jgi:LacI family transcriptional regulator
MKHNPRSITIHDVAKAAGVSVTTISRVLNDKDDVASETYDRVKRVIQELGYASSLAARGMRSHRTKVIGLITPEVTSPYSIAVLQGINWALTQLDYDMVIYSNMNYRRNLLTPQEAYFVSLLNGNIADGVIVLTPVTTCFSVSTAPIVVVDPNNETPNYPAIIATHREGACQAVQYLIGLGHRRIGFINGRHELVSSAKRLQGYRDSLMTAGIPIDEALIETGDYTSETATTCTRRLLELDIPPTAIFAANDQTAMGVYRVAREKGVRIPEDLSVVGFDNLRESSLLTPPLTTVDQFLFNMGQFSVEMLMKLINSESLDVHLNKINTQLVIRNSCCSPEPHV